MSLSGANESEADRIFNGADAAQKMVTHGDETGEEGDAELRALEQKRLQLLQQWSEMAPREEGEISDNESPESPDNSVVEAYLPEQPVVRDLWRFRQPPTRPRTPIVPLSRAESVERALDVDAFNTSGDLDLRLCAPPMASSSTINEFAQQETLSRPSSTGFPSSAAEFIALRTSCYQPTSCLPAPPTPPSLIQSVTTFENDGLSAPRPANVDGLDRSFDNYETVCMDIESDSESTSRGAAQQAADDEAEALRQLLLSQVSKKKPTDAANAVPPATHRSEVETREPGELPPGSPGTAVSAAKEKTRPPTSKESEKDRSRKKSTSEKPPSIDLKAKRNAARDQFKKLDELRDSVSFYQDKRQAAVQRKQRLMEQLAHCDDIINDHDKELSRLMDSIAKLSKDIAKSHVHDLLEVEEERDRSSHKRKSSEKPPRKSSKKPRAASPIIREREAVAPSVSSSTSKRNEREQSERLSPDKRSRRSYSRDSVNVATETGSSRREKTVYVSSKLLDGRLSKEVDHRAPRPSWIAEQLDLNDIVNEPAEAEAAEAEMLRRLMARQKQQPIANDVSQSDKAREVDEATRTADADVSSRGESRVDDVEGSGRKADTNQQQQQPQQQIDSNQPQQFAKRLVDEARLDFDFDAVSADEDGMDQGDEMNQPNPPESSQTRTREPTEPLPARNDAQHIAESDEAVAHSNESALQNGHLEEEPVHRPSAAEFFEDLDPTSPFEALIEDRNPSPSNSELSMDSIELPLTSVRSLDSPLFAVRTYRLCDSFPHELLRHPAFAQRIDPMIPLCPFQLHGRCADEKCPWQHEKDYHMSDVDIVLEYLLQFPSICPQGMLPDAFARRLLAHGSPITVVRWVLSQVPKGERRIKVDRNATNHVELSKPPETKVDYDVPRGLRPQRSS